MDPTRQMDARHSYNDLRRKPRARCDDQCLDSGLQRRMDYRRKFRAVIYWQCVEPVRRLCFRVSIRIRAAHKPEDRRAMPFGPERSEVFTGWSRARFANPLGAKISAERVNYPLTGIPVINIERIVIQRRNLWLAGGTGSCRLSIDDTLNRVHYARPYSSVERPHVQFDDGFVGNDVFFRPSLQRAHGYDGRLGGSDLARNNGLQPQHRRGRHYHRIDARLRHRSVRAAPEQTNLQAVRR